VPHWCYSAITKLINSPAACHIMLISNFPATSKLGDFIGIIHHNPKFQLAGFHLPSPGLLQKCRAFLGQSYRLLFPFPIKCPNLFCDKFCSFTSKKSWNLTLGGLYLKLYLFQSCHLAVLTIHPGEFITTVLCTASYLLSQIASCTKKHYQNYMELQTTKHTHICIYQI